MFTGLVTALGRISLIACERERRFRIESPYPLETLHIGDSIAHAGCCLTVTDKGGLQEGSWHDVQVSEETLSVTTLGTWREGQCVNLERPLVVGQELGGHFVSGHVDAVGHVLETSPKGGSMRLVFEMPAHLFRYLAQKGSVCIDGVSLTVNAVEEAHFEVNIIPHTQKVTSLGLLRVGDPVNIEVDLMARYAERLWTFTEGFPHGKGHDHGT